MELALSIFQVLKSLGVRCNMKSLGNFFSCTYVRTCICTCTRSSADIKARGSLCISYRAKDVCRLIALR